MSETGKIPAAKPSVGKSHGRDDRYWYEVRIPLRLTGLPRIIRIKVTDTDDPALPYTMLYGLAFSRRGSANLGIKMIETFQKENPS